MDINPAALPLTVTLSAAPAVPIALEPAGFTWTIIDAMTDDFAVEQDGDNVMLIMRFAGVTA